MFQLEPIGKIITPYNNIDDCPRNFDPEGPDCELVINEELSDGLDGLQIGQHILILYWFENVNRSNLRQKSRRTGELTGIFSLRTPNRCNPIGAAVLPIKAIHDNRVTVPGLDCLSGTHLLDIKPAMSGER